MKFLSTTSTLLALTANAEFGRIVEQLTIAVKSQNISLPETEAGGRAFVNPILNWLEPIYGYGCWCWFNEDWILAGGPVNDAIDQRCKQLINGYRCAKLDSKNRGEFCDPAVVPYMAYSLFGGGDLVSECRAANADACAQDACIIEGRFSLDYLPELMSGFNSANVAFQSSAGFNREQECLVAATNNIQDKECCGSQPTRYPFSASRGAHGCCGDSLYSTNVQECCMDQVGNTFVASIGACP